MNMEDGRAQECAFLIKTTSQTGHCVLGSCSGFFTTATQSRQKDQTKGGCDGRIKDNHIPIPISSLVVSR